MPRGAVPPDGAAPGMDLSLLDGSELAQFEDKEGSNAAVVYFVARTAFSSPPVKFTAQDVHADNGELPHPRICRLASVEELGFRMLTVRFAGNWAPVLVYALFFLGDPFETLPANMQANLSGLYLCMTSRFCLVQEPFWTSFQRPHAGSTSSRGMCGSSRLREQTAQQWRSQLQPECCRTARATLSRRPQYLGLCQTGRPPAV